MRISIAAFTCVMLLAAACHKHDDASSKPAATPVVTGAPSAGSAPPAGSEAPVPPGDNQACTLITQDEAGKLLGHAVKPGEARMFGPVPACHFKADGVTGSVNLQYFVRGDDNFDPIAHTMVKNAVPITGAGTKAVRNVDGSVLAVLANGHLAVVVRLGSKNERPELNIPEDFARTLASRL